MVYVLLLAAVVCWLVLDTAQRGTRQLVSFGGLLLLVFLMIVFSKHPFKVRRELLFLFFFFFFGHNFKLNFVVLVVMADFNQWDWTTVCLWSAHTED